MPTLEQLTQYLTSIGAPLPPDFVLQAWLDMVAVIQPCLDGAGYSPATQMMIYLYLLSLYSISSGDKYISSQTAPSGASQSFRYKGMTDSFRSARAMLNTLDTSGCTASVVPSEPGAGAGLWVSTGACK